MTKRICPAMMLLNPECRGCFATIKSFNDIDKQMVQKLTRLGVCEGCNISALKRPTADPVVFIINNSHIALRKQEAEKLLVEIIQ